MQHISYVALLAPTFLAGVVLAVAVAFQSFRKEW